MYLWSVGWTSPNLQTYFVDWLERKQIDPLIQTTDQKISCTQKRKQINNLSRAVEKQVFPPINFKKVMKITKIKVYQARIYFWIFFVLTKSPFFSGGFATGGWKLQMGWWQKCGNLWFDDCCHSDRSSWWNCRVILHVNCQSILFLKHKLKLFWA